MDKQHYRQEEKYEFLLFRGTVSLSSATCGIHTRDWQFPQSYSGSVLGRIHHLDPRAPASVIGAVVQKEGLCSLQWSPGGDWLASGSTGGLLSIWDSDITGCTRSHQPVITMKQPSAVKVSACFMIGAWLRNENSAAEVFLIKLDHFNHFEKRYSTKKTWSILSVCPGLDWYDFVWICRYSVIKY